MYSRYKKKHWGCCSIYIRCVTVFLNCISQLCFSTGFLDYLSQLGEEEAILDIGAAVPSVPCVRLGSHHFAGEPSLRSPRGGHNTQYRGDTIHNTERTQYRGGHNTQYREDTDKRHQMCLRQESMLMKCPIVLDEKRPTLVGIITSLLTE